MDLRYWLARAVDVAQVWGERFGPFEPHPSHLVEDGKFAQAFDRFADRMADNFPFFHPRYAGQMVKPPHPAAVVGYLTAMLFNPNNHAVEGGPATSEMERECVAALAGMFGLPAHLGHLTTSGTIANLEALYVARESHPDRGVAFSTECHYTHGRMCDVLGVEAHRLPVDAAGRVEVDAVERVLSTGRVGTVVVTAGTTGLGAVDPVHEVLPLARRYGARVHVDAAYGGFFTLLAGSGQVDPAPWRAIAGCDSIAVDPHKHGLQPYGCGAVLFADQAARRHFAHDSPYTYFAEADLHLGEISLECSRAGAAAAALWLTLQLIPLTADGLGEILAAGRRAALRWADLIESSVHLRLYQRPELDIVTYFPRADSLRAADAASARLLHAGTTAPDDPVFTSVVRADADAFLGRHPGIVRDADSARILRSVLMKPETELYLDQLHGRLHGLAGRYATRPDTVDGGALDANRQTAAPARPTAFPITSADTGRLVELLTTSFFADPLAVWAFPDEARRAAILPEFFRAHVELSLDYDGVLTTPDRDAVMLFLPPGAWDKVEARDAELTERFAGIAGEYAEALLLIMGRQAERHPTDEPHYYVSFAGVEPSTQRRGVMQALASQLTAAADRAGVGMYTEASSAGGAGVSRWLGFVALGAGIVLPDGPTLSPLWREPR